MVFWNGPMGVFELAPYAAGTRAVASALVSGEAFSVVGGGDPDRHHARQASGGHRKGSASSRSLEAELR